MSALDSLAAAFQVALAGQFTLERELGRGGMGIVYLARDLRLDRLVAIKVLPPELARDTEMRERFLREARTAGQLAHPNIVPVYRADEAGGFAWFVMAYIDGESLGERVRARAPWHRRRRSGCCAKRPGPSPTLTRAARSIATSSRKTS